MAIQKVPGMEEKTRRKLNIIAKWAAIVGLNVVGGYAILLILYGMAVEFYPDYFRMKFLDAAAPWFSTVLTLLATLVTAFSAYLAPHSRQADVASKYVTAPIVIISILLAFTYIIVKRSLLPDHVLNGFALLAIVGVLFRLLPFSEEQGLA
jgi:cytochrome c biogenesis factor